MGLMALFLCICKFLASCLLSLSQIAPAHTDVGGAEPPAELRCENLRHPLGLGRVRPRFSWQVNDARRAAVQTAFQIVLDSASAGGGRSSAVWDSGKVQSDRSILAPYDGPPLSGRR